MFEIYIYDLKKKKLGFTFHLFENNRFVIDYSEHTTVTDLEYYLQDSKSDVIGLNLDKFVIFCDSNIHSKTILIEESISKLRKASTWRVKNKDKYVEFINLVARGSNLLYDLVNAQEKENKGKAKIMCLMMMSFIEKEVNAHEVI